MGPPGVSNLPVSLFKLRTRRLAIDAVTLCLAASLLVRAVLRQRREDRQ